MKKNTGLISRFKRGLKKTSSRIASVFTGNHIDENLWDELFESLVMADVGAPIVEELLETVKKDRKYLKNPQTLLEGIKNEAIKYFPEIPAEGNNKPYVILVVGVNGAGKTTTIAKMAKKYKEDKKSVLLCAADTFRAAAIDQLEDWAKTVGVPIVTPPENADPASVAFDGVKKAVKDKIDVVLIDTAGRLHTKHNLMEEMKKIERVIHKADENSPSEVLLVLDGTAGQNALAQAKVFNEAVKVTSIAITKLDGTAKGGIVLRIAKELSIPIKYVGLGEKAEDLVNFSPEAYVEGLFDS